ncbi:phage major capsid protein [Ekhidna sp.]|uniref:phage major capsid protein n=1 Tax=Ekhidna sp. TaxID=2608089 RepID=UPI003C7C2521
MEIHELEAKIAQLEEKEEKLLAKIKSSTDKKDQNNATNEIVDVQKELNDLSKTLTAAKKAEEREGQRAAEEGKTLTGDFNVHSNGTKTDKEFSLGKILQTKALKKLELQNKALSSSSDSDLIPTHQLNQIVPGLFNFSSFTKAGGVIRDLQSEPNGNKFEEAKVSTNVTGAWYAESDQIADSDPAFTAISPTFTKFALNVTVPNEVLQDMVVGAQFLDNHLQRRASEALDAAALAGSGSSNEPTGIINQSGINVVSLGSGDGAAFADYGKLIDAKEAILTAKGNSDSLSLIHHPRTLADLSNLQASDNQPLMKPEFLDDVDVLISQALPINGTVGSGTDLSTSILGNFSDAVVSIRLNPNVFIDPYRRSDYDQTVFRLTMRMAVTLRYAESFTKIRYIAAA